MEYITDPVDVLLLIDVIGEYAWMNGTMTGPESLTPSVSEIILLLGEIYMCSEQRRSARELYPNLFSDPEFRLPLSSLFRTIRRLTWHRDSIMLLLDNNCTELTIRV